ncbi:MAG: leucine-rich repeat domain-containing protein [Bacilli bacterium]|nr:leucine-rich repeat domain-containing protein [Bacilli bacterium]
MKKKSLLGFTLIELLAAMIIMVVIIAIAVPLVMNIIETVRMEAFRATAYSVADSGRLLIANENEAQGYQEFYYRDGLEFNADGRKLDYSGKGPITGIVILNEKNKVVLAIHNGTYCATKSADANTVAINKTTPEDCNAYSIIETCDTWEQIAIKYDVSLDDLLEVNNEANSESSTCDREIKIPVESISAGGSYADDSGDGDDGSKVYYKTYYTVGYIPYSSTLPFSYEYTIELGVLPLNISDVKTVNVTTKTVFESLEDFKRYIVKRNMGEVIWQGADNSPIDISQASVFRDHAADLSNMSAGNVSVICNTETCYATVSATVSNLNNVNPNTIQSVGQVVYTSIKFTVEFNGSKVCPTSPTTPESCFTFNSETGTITDYDYLNGLCPSDVVIPSTIGGVNVTAIGNSSFANNNLTCVSFPSSVTTIGNGTFASNKFTSLTIPETITGVGCSAFNNNQFTGGVVWNAPISSVGDGWDAIFVGSYVDLITFGPNVNKIPDNLLRNASLGFTEYTVPSHITNIGYNAFRNTGLTSVNLNNIEIIGGRSFENNKLISIDFPSSVKTIGNGAFASNRFTSLIIPETITGVGCSAFNNNQFTGGVVWNAPISSVGDGWDAIFVGSYVDSITFGPNVNKIPDNLLRSSILGFAEYTVPDYITNIGYNAFRSTGLTSVDLNNVITISGNSFASTKLTSLIVPETITGVGCSAFNNNQFTGGVVWNAPISSVGDGWDAIFVGSYVDLITFGPNVNKIPDNLLRNASLGFTEYTVPSHITNIGYNAFRNTGLTSVNLNNIEIIGGRSFENNKLISIDFPSSVKTIGNGAFASNRFTSLIVPETITGVGCSAFNNNQFTGGVVWNAPISSVGDGWDAIFVGSYVDLITFGPNVNKIPDNLLRNASLGFTEYTVPSHITNIGYNAFRNTGLTSVDLNNVEIIGGKAFESDKISTLYIPSSVISIGGEAFANNTTLTSVTIDNSYENVSVGSGAFGSVTPYYTE